MKLEDDDQETSSTSANPANEAPPQVESEPDEIVSSSEPKPIGIQTASPSDPNSESNPSSLDPEDSPDSKINIALEGTLDRGQLEATPTQVDIIQRRLVDLETKLEHLLIGIETQIQSLAARIEDRSEKDDAWKVLTHEELKDRYSKAALELTRHRDSQDDLGVRSLMEGLFPVYDTLVEKIENATSNPTEQETLKLLRGDLLEVLETRGVRPIIPESDEFDRARHQVIEVVATDEADREGKVAERIRTGFIRDGILILRKEWIKRYVFTEKGEETNG